MTTMPPQHRSAAASRWMVAPLYAAGFTTAFGAHGIAANLGRYTGDQHDALWILGILLAVYDGAEVVFKPVFGMLCDRIGPRPVLLGGLIGFAACSAAFAAAYTPGLLGLARLGQGIAAAAFSPAAGTLVARLAPPKHSGRAFGGYGATKSLGYAGGPLLGGVLVGFGGFTALFVTLAALAAAVAVWAALAVPATPPLPKTRQTVLDLARRLTTRNFVVPTGCLAATTAALAVGVGFLPVLGQRAGLGPIATGAAVSVLAIATTLIQPLAGRARDSTRITDHAGMATGLLVTAAGLGLAAALPGLSGLLAGAALTGLGVGAATPLGFAALATATPPERLGQTMGSAELGRELGDAGGPLLVAGIATGLTLTGGLAALAILVAAAGTLITTSHHRAPTQGAR